MSNTNLFYFLAGKRKERAKEDRKAASKSNASPLTKRTKVNKSVQETPTRSSARRK